MTAKEEKVVLFFGKEDIYSQFYPSTFEIDGFTYNCAEQYMMHQKAIVFKDDEIGKKIITESNPKTIKGLGRRVRNFDDDTWINICQNIVFQGNFAKFNQNKELKMKLLATGNRPIAEASPFDRRWGIGLGKSNPKAQVQKEWQGKNWLGEAIMKVRAQFVHEHNLDDI